MNTQLATTLTNGLEKRESPNQPGILKIAAKIISWVFHPVFIPVYVLIFLLREQSYLFVALPGGWGTLDELAEILTWRQLKLIDQPVGLLNVNAFFSPLLSQLKTMADGGFLPPENLRFLIIENSPSKLLTALGVVTV